MKMLWRCDGCGKEVESDPTSHSDWGGEITVQGPDCQDCEQPMDCIGYCERCKKLHDDCSCVDESPLTHSW